MDCDGKSTKENKIFSLISTVAHYAEFKNTTALINDAANIVSTTARR